MLNCSKCGADKPETEFSVRASRPRGYNSHCKACVKLTNKIQYDKNAVRNRASAAAYRAANPVVGSTYQAAYRAAHRDDLRAYFRDYAKANPHKKQATTVARRAKKLHATPSWANQDEIAAFYKRAADIASRTGTPMHVDHIVPLVHKLVCGLHCEANLRVIPAMTNLRKGNNFWPDMPNTISHSEKL